MASKHLETFIETFRPTERKVLYALVLTLGAYFVTRIYFLDLVGPDTITSSYRAGFPFPIDSVGSLVNMENGTEEYSVTGFFYPLILANFIFWYIVSAVGDRVNVSLS